MQLHQPLIYKRIQHGGDIRVLRRIFGHLLHRHLRHGQLAFALLPDQLLDGHHFIIEVRQTKVIQFIAGVVRFQQVSADHGVENDAVYFDAVARHDLQVILDVLPDNVALGVLQNGTYSRQHLIQFQGRDSPFFGELHRHVPPVVRLYGEGQPHNLGLQSIDGGGLQVKGEPGCC